MNPTALDTAHEAQKNEPKNEPKADVYDNMAEGAKTYVPPAKAFQLSLSDEEAIQVYGDLEKLSPQARLEYYRFRCERLGLDPFGHPFDYIRTPIDKAKTAYKTVLYANKNCASQLTKKHNVSTDIINEKTESGIREVVVRASTPIIANGIILGWRHAENKGAVAVAGIGGTDLANALKKTITQATNRAIFTLFGISDLDETEIDQIKGANQTVTPQDVEKSLNELKQRLLPPSSVTTTDASKPS